MSSLPDAPTTPGTTETEKLLQLHGEKKLRFQMELEFVEMLANPKYLEHLAQLRYFADSAFVNYLQYLLYWKQPKYIKYIRHPHCLYFLELLQTDEFRARLLEPGYVSSLQNNQFWHWRTHRFNRWREAGEERAQVEEKAAAASKTAAKAEETGDSKK